MISMVVVAYAWNATAAVFEPATTYQVCFTPQQACTRRLVDLIDHAQQSILVQAYTFTSRSIARALVRAAHRAVKVRVILDDSNFNGNFYSPYPYLLRNGITIWRDYLLNIAHNKVMIVDCAAVETGSFNYTYAAQHMNAENMLIIKSHTLAKQYSANWYRRQRVAQQVKPRVAIKNGLSHVIDYLH